MNNVATFEPRDLTFLSISILTYLLSLVRFVSWFLFENWVIKGFSWICVCNQVVVARLKLLLKIVFFIGF